MRHGLLDLESTAQCLIWPNKPQSHTYAHTEDYCYYKTGLCGPWFMPLHAYWWDPSLGGHTTRSETFCSDFKMPLYIVRSCWQPWIVPGLYKCWNSCSATKLNIFCWKHSLHWPQWMGAPKTLLEAGLPMSVTIIGDFLYLSACTFELMK